jgi:hypothetical protein
MIVKVQTNTTGSSELLIYDQQRLHVQIKDDPELAKDMGPLAKRFYHAKIDKSGAWALKRKAPWQDW